MGPPSCPVVKSPPTKSGAAAKSLQSCPTLCDPIDSSPPGSSVPGTHQARILEGVAISFSRGSSQPRDRAQISHIAGRSFTICHQGSPGYCKQCYKEHWEVYVSFQIMFFSGYMPRSGFACSSSNPIFSF